MHRTYGTSRLWLVAFASVAFGAVAMGQVVVRNDRAPRVTRVKSEQAVAGLTRQQFLDHQSALHQRLASILPAASERATASVGITDQELTDLIRDASTNESPMRVGVVKSLTPEITFAPANVSHRAVASRRINAGPTKGSESVWAATITSPGAVAIRVRLENVRIPNRAELYFLNDAGEAYGPYTGTGRNQTGAFWSDPVMGDSGTVLLRGADLAHASLRITKVAHVAIDFAGPASDGGIASFCTYNASCIENNSCIDEPAVNDAEWAVAKMRWIDGAYIYICSGGLIADTDPDTQIPYFLTANHCISSDTTASNLVAYFQFTLPCGSTACTGSFNAAPSPRTVGATVVATGMWGDFTLLQLSQTPPAGSIYLGWNSTPIAYTDGADLHRVSHPMGAPQAYSHHQVDAFTGTCGGWPRGAWIYSQDILGATEGGSSGSPVVNAAGEVVGQLSGCCGYHCDNPCAPSGNYTVDGAFAYYFNLVEPYLSPPVIDCFAPSSVSPDVDPPGNRYITFDTPDNGVDCAAKPMAIRVRLTSLDGFAVPPDDVRWVGEPFDAPDEDTSQPDKTFRVAPLSCDPVFRDWSDTPTVSVFGGDIVPGSTYTVDAVYDTCADLSDPACYSTERVIVTGTFGDVVAPFDGSGSSQPDFGDISAEVGKFLADPSAPSKKICQLDPQTVFPERPIDFNTISVTVDAFGGTTYASEAFGAGPCMCPSSVTCGATPCANDTQCSGGLCIDGFCRDACRRCTP